MAKLCRTDDADLIAAKFEKMKPGAFTGGIVLICVVFFAELIVYAFMLMDDSPFEKPFLIFSLISIVLILYGIYMKQKNADGEFMVYIMDDSEITAVDIARACKNDTLFGAQYSISFGKESSNWHKIIKNMKKINTTSHFEEFAVRPDVLVYSGYTMLRVFEVKEKSKIYKVKARLKPMENSNVFMYEHTKTLRIPKSFTNSEELIEELRSLQ